MAVSLTLRDSGLTLTFYRGELAEDRGWSSFGSAVKGTAETRYGEKSSRNKRDSTNGMTIR